MGLKSIVSKTKIATEFPSPLHVYIHIYTQPTSIQKLPRTRTRYGDRAFSVIAPTIWNNLPTHIRDAPSLDSFKSLLKTHLFIQS